MPDKPALSRREARALRVKALRDLIDLLAEIERDSPDDSLEDVLGLPKRDDPHREAYAKLPLTEAIPIYLAACKEPQTAKQIWVVFSAAGREMVTENPVRAIKQALRELLVINSDVFHEGWSRWYLKSKCSPAQLKKLAKAPQNGTGGRSVREHTARTVEGMERAKARGVRLGAEPMAPEKREAIKADLLDDKLTNKEIADKHGIGVSTIPYLFKGGRRKLQREHRQSEAASGAQLRLVK
jgi:hypothetical protein